MSTRPIRPGTDDHGDLSVDFGTSFGPKRPLKHCVVPKPPVSAGPMAERTKPRGGAERKRSAFLAEFTQERPTEHATQHLDPAGGEGEEMELQTTSGELEAPEASRSSR